MCFQFVNSWETGRKQVLVTTEGVLIKYEAFLKNFYCVFSKVYNGSFQFEHDLQVCIIYNTQLRRKLFVCICIKFNQALEISPKFLKKILKSRLITFKKILVINQKRLKSIFKIIIRIDNFLSSVENLKTTT